MVSKDELAAVSDNAECVASPGDICRALDNMANDLSQGLGDDPLLLLCVMNGGLLVAAELLKRISADLTVDYIHATRYRDTTQGKEMTWRALPSRSLVGHQVVVVDDIFDEGRTLAAIAEFCQAQGASRVISMVLVDKIHQRKVAGFKPDIIGLQLPDRYLYGFGMDYKGYFRNRPAIFAVTPPAC